MLFVVDIVVADLIDNVSREELNIFIITNIRNEVMWVRWGYRRSSWYITIMIMIMIIT